MSMILDNVIKALRPPIECLVVSMTDYFAAATEEKKALTILHGAEAQAVLQECEPKPDPTIKRTDVGMMKHPYGFCPKCGESGQFRSRQSGDDRCINGHRYPSNTAVLRFDKPDDDRSEEPKELTDEI